MFSLYICYVCFIWHSHTALLFHVPYCHLFFMIESTQACFFIVSSILPVSFLVSGLIFGNVRFVMPIDISHCLQSRAFGCMSEPVRRNIEES